MPDERAPVTRRGVSVAICLGLACAAFVLGSWVVLGTGYRSDAAPNEAVSPSGADSYMWNTGKRQRDVIGPGDELYLAYSFAYGRTANRLYGFLGALAVAKLTDRTLIIPTHLHLDDIQHVDYDALSKEGVQVISEKEYRRLQFVGRLQNSDVALEKSIIKDTFWKPLGPRVHANLHKGHYCATFSMTSRNIAASLAALHASHRRCRLAVFPELLHVGALTPWLGFRPPHVPRLAALPSCSLEPSTTGQPPCLARYITFPTWVERSGSAFLRVVNHSGPTVAVHLRKLPDSSCGHGVVPVSPCCQPDATHVVSRLHHLGLLSEDSPAPLVILMLDGSGHMWREGQKICAALPEGTCHRVPQLVTQAIADKAHRKIGDVGVLVDMFLAEQADYFIGNRLSSLTNWVSQARLRAGKLNSTVTMCDDEPPSWLLPFPPAVQPAGVSLDTCRAQDITTMFHLAAAHGCCYQFNPHTQRDRGHSDAEQWALPTQADLGVSLA